MADYDDLKELILDVFLLDDDEFSWSMSKADVETWDSLGVVALATGVQETTGYHMTPDEAVGIQSVADLVDLLIEKGVLSAHPSK